MKSHLLSILACPQCKGPLHFEEQSQRLICQLEKLAFPIVDDIPRLMIANAEKLNHDSGAS